MNQESYLYHHGVKGMKWGVRKDKRSSQKDNYDYLKKHSKYANWSNHTDGKKLNNNKTFKKAASSKKMKKLAKRSQEDYAKYHSEYIKDYNSKKTSKAAKKFEKSINKLRKEADKQSTKLLGKYKNSKVTHYGGTYQTGVNKGKEYLYNGSAKNLLKQTLVEISINDYEKK